MKLKSEEQRHEPDKLILRNLRAIREDIFSNLNTPGWDKSLLKSIVLEIDYLFKVEAEANTTEYLSHLTQAIHRIEKMFINPLYSQYYDQLQATALVGLEYLEQLIESEITELEKATAPDIIIAPTQSKVEEAYVQNLKTLLKLTKEETDQFSATTLCQLYESMIQTQRKFIESVKHSKAETVDETIARLNSQLGDYPKPTHGQGVIDLSVPGREHLFTGVEAYKKLHSKFPPDYYRKQFIKYIAELADNDKTNFHGNEKIRKNSPEDATIKAEELLGKKGLELYKLALQEEAYSKEYREAVFNSSTKFIEGNKWTKTNFIMIPGPSASGKSFVTDIILREQINELPQKNPNDNSGNTVICVDGGTCREVSQMRKLAIRAANKKGYSGIENLHGHSKILEDVKTHVKNAAIESPSLSIAMPETYSTWLIPFSGHKEFIDKVSKSQRQLTFAIVVGEDKENFREVVCYMGTRRAYKTDNFDQVVLDLNSIEGLTESKVYGPSGFDFGVEGSYDALKCYNETQEKNGKPILILNVVNDLILLREKEVNSENWISAKPGEEGIFMVSQYTYNQWNRQSVDQKANMGLREYAKANPHIMIKRSKDFEKLLMEGVAPVGRVSLFGAPSDAKGQEKTVDSSKSPPGPST